MGRKAKCKECGIELEKENRYKYSNGYLCKICYDKKILEKVQRNTLIDTIMNYFNLKNIDGLILKQIKDYKKTYNYTYDGMTYTLWYCKEILKKDFNIKYGIAIIKYEYRNAENYFINQQNISNSLKKIKEPKVNNIKINLSKVFKKDNNNFLIDLDKIAQED